MTKERGPKQAGDGRGAGGVNPAPTGGKKKGPRALKTERLAGPGAGAASSAPTKASG